MASSYGLADGFDGTTNQFVRLPESHCNAPLLDYRVSAAEEVCRCAAVDPNMTLGDVGTTHHPATEALYIRARLKKSLGDSLPAIEKDRGYRNLFFTDARSVARCYDKTVNRAGRHDLSLSAIGAGEAAAKQGMTAAGSYRSEGCRELMSFLEQLELSGCDEQVTYSKAAEVLTMIIDLMDDCAHVKSAIYSMTLSQVESQAAAQPGTVKFLRIGDNDEAITCWVTRNTALVSAVGLGDLNTPTFTDRLYLLNARDICRARQNVYKLSLIQNQMAKGHLPSCAVLNLSSQRSTPVSRPEVMLPTKS